MLKMFVKHKYLASQLLRQNASQLGIQHSNRGLLGLFGQVDLNKVLELVGGNALGDGVDVGQGLCCVLEWVEGDEGADGVEL